jgi:hypothetical protein
MAWKAATARSATSGKGSMLFGDAGNSAPMLNRKVTDGNVLSEPLDLSPEEVDALARPATRGEARDKPL